MKLSLITLLSLVASAYAGLEDAKNVKVLTAKNFDATIREPEVGTLVAFFAPWCGHCKNLEGTWSKVGKAFESDSKCNVAILDADNAAHKPFASRFGVSGFPTIKFLPSNGGSPIDYASPRTEDAFLAFLNKQCGTHRLPGGGLSELAGRLPSLDKLAAQFMAASSNARSDLLAQAKALAEKVNESASAVYLKTFQKVQENDSYLKTEAARIGKLLQKRSGLANKKIEELQIKSNILKAFDASAAAAQDAASDTAEKAQQAGQVVQDKAADASKVVSEQVVSATDRVKQEL